MILFSKRCNVALYHTYHEHISWTIIHLDVLKTSWFTPHSLLQGDSTNFEKLWLKTWCHTKWCAHCICNDLVCWSNCVWRIPNVFCELPSASTNWNDSRNQVRIYEIDCASHLYFSKKSIYRAFFKEWFTRVTQVEQSMSSLKILRKTDTRMRCDWKKILLIMIRVLSQYFFLVTLYINKL